MHPRLRVDAQYAVEMSAPENEDAIEAVAADGAHPALGERVRVRCLDGSPDHLDSLGTEDIVEGMRKLRVAVPDQQVEAALLLAQLHALRACWAIQAPSGFGVLAMNSSRRVASERKKST
jgi:hypothetical protein